MAMFNFAAGTGGLSQTDWFGLGTGAMGTGYAAAAYNQAAYLGSLAMRQCQMYQAKNYHLSWVAVARDDIRDMMNISVTRISNYMMVAALILGVASDALLGINFDSSCPSFIVNAFWVSIGLSILFFTMSIMFAVKGQNSAFLNTMRLLTWELRPENPCRYTYDYMQANSGFEHSGLSNLLRIPGLRARFGEEASAGSAGPQENQDKNSNKGGEEGRGGFLNWLAGGATHDKTGSSSSRAAHGHHGDKADHSEAQFEHVVPKTQQLLYLARFGHFMQLWQPYDTHSKNCIGLGLISLVKGAAYFCLGHLVVMNQYTYDFIACVMVGIFFYITVSVNHQSFHAKHCANACAIYVLFGIGPIAATIAAVTRNPELITWFAPGCMLGHTLFYVAVWLITLFEFKKPWDVTKKYTTGPAGQQFPEDWTRAVQETSGGLSSDEDSDGYGSWNNRGYGNDRMEKPHIGGQLQQADQEREEREQKQFSQLCDVQRPSILELNKVMDVNNSVQSTTRKALAFGAIVWFATFAATVMDSMPRVAFWISQNPGNALRDITEIDIHWPMPNFVMTSLACERGRLIGSNPYQVFDINVTSGSVDVLPCGNLDNVIVDVSLACPKVGQCQPLVLLENSSIIDCSSGLVTVLLQESAAERFTLSTSTNSNPLDGVMLTDSNGTIVQHRWDPTAKGWKPLWALSVLTKEEIATSLETVGDSIILFFDQTSRRGWHHHVNVKVLSKDDLLPQESLHLPFEPETNVATSAACADSDFVFLAQSGFDGARLVRAAM